MLGKMIIHGLVAAAVIAGAAAVYAQTRSDNGYLPSPAASPSPSAEAKPVADNGYLPVVGTFDRKHGHDDHEVKHERRERHHDGHKRDHDDDDD